jgi:hypothetical protein
VATIAEVYILLFGFSVFTCAILFGDAWWRRISMAAALGCAFAIIVVNLIGSERVVAMIVLASLVRDWWRERCMDREAEDRARRASRAQARAVSEPTTSRG